MLMLESLLEQSGKTLLHFKYGGKMENIENLKVNTLLAINDAADLKMLDEIRVSVLGKKGAITDLMKGLATLSVDEKKEMGKTLNVLKSESSSTGATATSRIPSAGRNMWRARACCMWAAASPAAKRAPSTAPA